VGRDRRGGPLPASVIIAAVVLAHGDIKVIDGAFFGLSDAGLIVCACLMGLWTTIQILLNLVQPDEN
jgi:hypothetical protein